jgi:hypothetical protein
MTFSTSPVHLTTLPEYKERKQVVRLTQPPSDCCLQKEVLWNSTEEYCLQIPQSTIIWPAGGTN